MGDSDSNTSTWISNLDSDSPAYRLARMYAMSGVLTVPDVCGDSVIGTTETCDDGGTLPGDGCDAACQIEAGYSCTGEPSSFSEVCGDGIITVGEACDDGGTGPGDGCDAVCQLEPGYGCIGEPSVCDLCGNGVVAAGETCDDAGTTQGDGCDAICQTETDYFCSGEPSLCRAGAFCDGGGG
jgi:cysteine-rich repeat protein